MSSDAHKLWKAPFKRVEHVVLDAGGCAVASNVLSSTPVPTCFWIARDSIEEQAALCVAWKALFGKVTRGERDLDVVADLLNEEWDRHERFAD